ncbi:MAG TPA: hypothetical protein VNH19_10730 [Candidatus Limnocylindrales bacterium]|nr:hypothetical protein [Candidatus Limnocylindrales bacterium]
MNASKNIQLLVLIGFAPLLPALALAEKIFTRGIVLAKILGPNDLTPDTAAKKTFDTNEVVYFWTTIKVVEADEKFGKELEGKTLKLMTGYFDKKLIGKTLPLQLYFVQEERGEKIYRFECTEVNTSVLMGKWATNSFTKRSGN